MEECSDFLQLLDPDVSMKILMYLYDPSDLVRISSVSRYWHQFVIKNGLCKQLCLRRFPEVSSFEHVIEVSNKIEPIGIGSHTPAEWTSLRMNNRVYAFLARALTSFMRKECILEAIGASSTDHYPAEGIQNTLVPNYRRSRVSYWSSKGVSDPTVPETLTYRLVSKLCVISAISIQPFRELFRFYPHIYSARAVQFRMGHLKPKVEIQSNFEFSAGQESMDNYYSWTYVSPEFPMAQENCLQKFKLPKPVLCIGGILQIVLLGRVQKHVLDNLFYICVSHVQVLGRPLSPAFDVETRTFTLKYYPEAEYCISTAKLSKV